MRIKLIKDMEIDFRKYNLTEVRESAWDYIRMLSKVHCNYSTSAIKRLGSKEQPIPEIETEAVTRLHNAIAAIDRDAVVKVLGNYKDFEEHDPRGWVESAKSALKALLPLITRERLHIAKRIDLNLKQLRQDCQDMITWLDQQLEILNVRDYMTPTLEEEAWIEELPDMEVADWLALYIFIPELSVSSRKRLLTIALAADGIDDEKKARLHEALAQIDEQIKEAARGEQAAEHNACISTEPRTDRAKQAFAKALELDFMIKTSNGYKWTFDNGSKVSLGYFICMVYNQDNTRITPFKALGKLFGVSRLDRAAEQATSAKKPQPWRDGIDKLLQSLESNT